MVAAFPDESQGAKNELRPASNRTALIGDAMMLACSPLRFA